MSVYSTLVDLVSIIGRSWNSFCLCINIVVNVSYPWVCLRRPELIHFFTIYNGMLWSYGS